MIKSVRFSHRFRVINERCKQNRLSERSESLDNGSGSYRRFLDGDDNGFVEIVRDYKDGLVLYLNSFVNNITVAEELAEDTFVKLGIKKPRDNGKSSFKTWLYIIGRNVAIDYIRKRSKSEIVSIDNCAELESREQVENSYFREESKKQLHKAMCNLKDEYQQVLWLIYFEDLTSKEAAKIMKKSVHGIETLTYRARQSLKKELIREGFTYENL